MLSALLKRWIRVTAPLYFDQRVKKLNLRLHLKSQQLQGNAI